MNVLMRTMLPYGMHRMTNGAWIFFNRNYSPVGIVTDEFTKWNDQRHLLMLKKLTPSIIRKIDCDDSTNMDRIYLYDDISNPARSADFRWKYLNRLSVLINLK